MKYDAFYVGYGKFVICMSAIYSALSNKPLPFPAKSINIG